MMIDVSLMLVEDDTQLREMLEKILKKELHLVQSYPQAIKALEALEIFTPDILITDIKMEGQSGLEMVKEIRHIYPDMPIIIVSAFREPECFIKAIDLKVNHFLTKPVDMPKLLEMIKNISLELSLKRELQEQKILLEQYKHIVDLSNHITITDKRGIITYVNNKFCALSGYTKEQLLGKPHSIVRHPDMPQNFYKNLWETILTKKVWQGLIKNQSKNGEDFYIETTIAPILDKNDEIAEFISIKTDITNLILNKKQLQREIITDRLTGLPNRIKLQEDIKNKKDATLIIFDIKHFKEINLLFGIKLGDEALIYIADTISKLIRPINGTTLYRISADEFVIHKSGKFTQEFEDLAYTLNSFVEGHPFSYKGTSFDINFTCAIAYKGNQTQNLLEAALDALDSAKNNKHFLHFFDKSTSKQQEYEQNFEWTKKIKEALLEERIQAYYQAIYNITSKKIIKYESLVRLIAEDGTVISPYKFLKIAKRSTLYSAITRTVITQACSTFANREETVTVNVSIEDLLDTDTMNFFVTTVSKYKMQGRVVAEVLESEGVDNFEAFSKVITQLKENGISIAIDDFGSGYSNFAYLINLEIDILKIDGSLIKHINTDMNAKIIVQSIVMFGRELGMQTVAEFVSDKEIFETLKTIGVDLLQGYYISMPLPQPLEPNSIIEI